MVDNGFRRPSAQEVIEFHTNSDVDSSVDALHHSLGLGPNQAAVGSHRHTGADSLPLLEGDEITGAKSGNTALSSVIAILVKLGAKDSTT